MSSATLEYSVSPSQPEKSTASDASPLEIDETAMLGEVEAAALQSRTRPKLAGDTFGRYRILKTLGEGAMGSVYLALDTQLQRKVALKIPKVSAKEQSRFIERFLREARSAATLNHPNICPVYDVGEIDGVHFITMGYIQGHSLADFVDPARPQQERHVATALRKIALALHEAHMNGLVHRDVKPANIMIDRRNEPIIMDFGLARQIDDEEDARLTRDGAILGSPAYMSPEQIEAKPEGVGPASDIYSLGVIQYELLTGRLPYQGSVASIIGQILSREPVPPRELRPEIHPQLADICLKAMAKKPSQRYATMKEYAQALADFLKNRAEELGGEKRRGRAEATDSEESLPRGPADSSLRLEAPSTLPANDTPGLKVVRDALEVTCKCGQRMTAKPSMAGKLVRCPRCAEILQIPGSGSSATSTSAIQVGCQHCGQRFLARQELAGKAVRCPVCSKPLTVPRPGVAAVPTRSIEVFCGCGQHFLARADLAGKRVKCTSCGQPIVIPAPS